MVGGLKRLKGLIKFGVRGLGKVKGCNGFKCRVGGLGFRFVWSSASVVRRRAFRGG